MSNSPRNRSIGLLLALAMAITFSFLPVVVVIKESFR